MDFSGYSKILRFKLFGKNLVSISFARSQTVFTGCNSFYSFFFFKRLKQKLSLLCSLLLLDLVEEDNLLVMFSSAQRASFDEITENSRLCELVNKSIWLDPILLRSKFWKIKAVPRIYPLWKSTICVMYIFEKLPVVRHNFRHELEKCISNFNLIDAILIFIVRINKNSRKCKVCHF